MSVLELAGVVKQYRSAEEQVRAVDGVSLVAQAGEMIAVHGPSGSGKTTLLLLIAALLEPDEGVIRYGGRDLASFSEDEASDYLLGEVGLRLSELPADASGLDARERGDQARARRRANARRPAASRDVARASWPWRATRAHARAPLRRRASAGRDRACARGRAEADPRRRADREPRQQAQQGDRRAAGIDRARARRVRAAGDARHRGSIDRRPPLHAARRAADRARSEGEEPDLLAGRAPSPP